MFKDRNKPNERPGEPEAARAPSEMGEAMTQQIEDLTAQIEMLTKERDEAKAAYVRSLADFQNYQRRSLENEREAKRQGVTALLLSVVPVIDHFDMALGMDPAKMSSQQVVDGVRAIRDEILRVLSIHGVTVVNPSPNDELDPSRHHAVMQMEADGVEPGRISKTLQVGYLLGERLIRPANVAVAPGNE